MRKLHINNQVWQWEYKVRYTCVVIRDPNGGGHYPLATDVAGCAWDALERGERKHYFYMLPNMVKDYIEENLLDKVKPVKKKRKKKRNRFRMKKRVSCGVT